MHETYVAGVGQHLYAYRLVQSDMISNKIYDSSWLKGMTEERTITIVMDR